MSVTDTIAMPIRKTAAGLAALREKAYVLRGKRLWPIIAWPVAALLLGAIGWIALFAKLDEDRRDIEHFALQESGALSRSYAGQLGRTVEAVDQILLHVKFEWELSNGRLRLEHIRSKGLFPDPSFFNVVIIDRDGRLVTSGIPHRVDAVFTDRQYFMAQKNSNKDTLYIGPPVVSRISKRHVLLFSRKLAAADGSFDGVVVISVAPDYLAASYDETSLGKYGFLGIEDNDRILVTRLGQSVYPPGTPALVRAPRFAQPSGSTLMNGNEWFSDKRSRYVGWSGVPGLSLVAMTGLDQQAALAPYFASRAASIRVAIWASVALAVFTLIAMILSIRLAWRNHQLQLIQTTYRMATEGGSEGFYIARPVRNLDGAIADFEVIDSNRRGAEFLRHRREDLIGKRITALYQVGNPDRVLEMLRQAMDAGFHESELEVPGESPVDVRWAHLNIVRSGGDLAITLRDISDTKAHVEELERRGNEDALTGLPNRHWAQAYLPQAIERAAANRSMLALLFVDLDGFKQVNDTMGHPVGDELLRNAARRLSDAVRPHDHVVRLGGDEFLVVVEGIAHKTDPAHVAERIQQAFHESFRLSQGVHLIGASIGISVFPSDGIDADTLLRRADIAMFSVKSSGKAHYRFYDQKFYDALRARMEQEAELRHAIEHDQFVLYYQPRVDVLSGSTSSMEALVRWSHPSKGLIEPFEFIPLAEETGLILGLGELVIDKVCAQLAYWGQKGEELVPVSVNVSPRQFNEADIADILANALERHKIDPKLLEVELTESSMMGDSIDVASALTAIRRMGIKLLVDDFGTGYSSLSQLQRLDFDVLKVDRAFTSEIEKTEKGNVFFKAIITMAHALGMRVVAEGVENERQIKILKSLHCDEIQGFYISRPIPPTERQPILPKWFFSSIA